jgi:hypothetical protein
MHFFRISFLLLLLFAQLQVRAQEQGEEDSLLTLDSLSEIVAPASQYPPVEIFRAAKDPVILRSVPDTVSKGLKKNKVFEYANDPEYWIREKPDLDSREKGIAEYLADFFARPAVRAFLYLLFFAFLIFVIVKVVIINRLFIFSSASKKLKTSEPGQQTENMEEDLEEKINAALLAKDHRSAVRYLYLKTLHLLDKKGWISFNSQATNHIYRNQVNHYAKGKEFSSLSTIYEYVWYGNFELTPSQFETVLNKFQHFQSGLKV